MISMIKRMREREEGFTLVELLVVILIIGILLAIALPTFLNQQDKANDTAAKQNLDTAYKVAKSQSVDHQGDYFVKDDYSATKLAAAISASEPELRGVVATTAASSHSAADSNGVVVVDPGNITSDSITLVAKSNSNGGTYCTFSVSGNVPQQGGPSCPDSN